MWIHLLLVIVMEIINTILILNDKHSVKIMDTNVKYDEEYVVFSMNILNIIFCLLFLVPLTILVWVQINNLLFNKTTFERFNLHKNRNNRVTSSVG